MDWVHLKLNDQAQRTVLCKDPFKSLDERVEKLIGPALVPRFVTRSVASILSERDGLQRVTLDDASGARAHRSPGRSRRATGSW